MEKPIRTKITVALATTLLACSAHAAGDDVLRVDAAAAPGGDGLTWATAHRFLQDALAAAAERPGTVAAIHLAGGRYRPDRGADRTPGDRTASFRLLEGVVLVGGHLGLDAEEGEDPDRRDVEGHATVLSGDLAGDDGPGFANRADNSLHVVRGDDVDETAGLDGLVVAGGHADGDEVDSTGAGLLLYGARPTIVGCVIRDNLAGFQGGGMQGKDGSDASFTDCLFTGNRALDNGGAVYLGESSPLFLRCEFRANEGRVYAGGTCNREGSNAIFDRCLFVDNRAAEDEALGGGGAAMVNAHSDPHVIDCVFRGNRAPFGRGGALVNEPGLIDPEDGSRPVVTGCTFEDNEAARGGAIYDKKSAATFRSCTMRGNRATIGGAVYATDSASRTVDSIFRDNVAGTGGAMYHKNSSPRVERCQFLANHADTGDGGGGLWNDGGAPLVDQCTFVANTGVRGGGLYNGTGNRAEIRRCTFVFNTSSEDGGGVSNDSSAPTIADCAFFGNVATGGSFVVGGGMSSYLSSPTVVRCTFEDNRAEAGLFVAGGGMANENGFGGVATVVDCTFVDNAAPIGGGMFNFRAGPLVVNGLFARNRATAKEGAAGGAMYNDFSSSPRLVNCTITLNEAPAGAALDSVRGAPVVVNSILWRNGPAPVTESDATTTIRYSLVEGGWDGAGDHVADADPRFVDPGADDWRLGPGSPAVDAGHDWLVPTDALDVDADGDRRELHPRDRTDAGRFVDDPDAPDSGCGPRAVVDLGAHERPGDAPVERMRLGDLDGDGAIDFLDLVSLLSRWGPCPADCCVADLDVNGAVDFEDLVRLLASW